MKSAATFCFHGYRPGCCSHPSCKHAAASAAKLCPNPEPHGLHEWYDGMLRRNCPGKGGKCGAATSRVEQGADSVQLNPESAPASSAAQNHGR